MGERPSIPLTIYAQDGTLVTMRVADTPSNRHLTEWIRQHDRYTVHGEDHSTGGR